MLNLLKFFFAVSFLKENKIRLIFSFIVVVFIVFFNSVSDEIITVSTKQYRIEYVIYKWVVLLALTSFLVFNLYRIFSNLLKTIPGLGATMSNHKKKILESGRGLTRAETVIRKHKK